MSSTSQRFSVTLDEDARFAVNSIAQRYKISKAEVIKKLVNEALEREEELWLSSLVTESLKEPYNPIPHEEVEREARRRD